AFQADSGAPASPVSQGTGAVMEMMGNMGGIAFGVLVLLLIASLYSWTIILGKMGTFGKATRESRNFINAFRRATRLQEVAAFARELLNSLEEIPVRSAAAQRDEPQEVARGFHD